MKPTNTPTPSQAVRNALKRARTHAGTAAVAALLAPFAAAPAAAAPVADITATVTPKAGNVTTFTYHVSSSTYMSVYEFELPELHANDFDLSSFVGPHDWTVSENATAAFGSTGFKPGGPTPGAYLLFQTRSNGIAETSSDFALDTTVAGLLSANFTAVYGTSSRDDSYFFGGSEQIDPPVPGSVQPTSVPEPPATALLFGGLAAALAVARRRKV